MTEKPLRLLGLARKAGHLVTGLDAVRSAAGRSRLLLLANDAGASASREARYLSRTSGVPLLELPYSREELGRAVGKKLCAAAALTDKGLAEAVANGIGKRDDIKNNTAGGRP